MNQPGFTTPIPMKHVARRCRIPAITMATDSKDLSILKLQSLQRTLASRGKSLRARGIRGKADEAAEQELKFRKDAGLGDVMDKDSKLVADASASKNSDSMLRSKARNHDEARTLSENASVSSEFEAGRKHMSAPVTSASEDNAKHVWSNTEKTRNRMKHAAKKGGDSASTQGPVKLNATLGIHSSLGVRSAQPPKPQRAVDGQTGRSVHSLSTERLEQSAWKVSNVTVRCGDGSLPWKQDKVMPKSPFVVQDYHLPLLESFRNNFV